jgi:hypothetical protein
MFGDGQKGRLANFPASSDTAGLARHAADGTGRAPLRCTDPRRKIVELRAGAKRLVELT